MAARIEPLLTVADLDSCPDDNNRYELIDGELFVSRAPGIPHQRVLLNLEVALSNYLSGHPIGILVPGAGAIFSNHDAVIPDLVFVRNERWPEAVSNNKFTAGLDLAIDFLSLVIFATHTDSQSDKYVARKFDEFGDVYVTDIKARADNFAIELQNNPMTKGFIIVYRSRRDLPGLSFRYADRIREYLVSTR